MNYFRFPSREIRTGLAGFTQRREASVPGWLEEVKMPDPKTLERARKDAREGKAPSTQAGEFVREEIEHVREGKHGVRSAKQAIAIGLSKARRAGVPLAPPKPGTAPEEIRERAKRDSAKGRSQALLKPSRTRSQATSKALNREGKDAVSREALARQARQAAQKRKRAER